MQGRGNDVWCKSALLPALFCLTTEQHQPVTSSSTAATWQVGKDWTLPATEHNKKQVLHGCRVAHRCCCVDGALLTPEAPVEEPSS